MTFPNTTPTDKKGEEHYLPQNMRHTASAAPQKEQSRKESKQHHEHPHRDNRGGNGPCPDAPIAGPTTEGSQHPSI